MYVHKMYINKANNGTTVVKSLVIEEYYGNWRNSTRKAVS